MRKIYCEGKSKQKIPFPQRKTEKVFPNTLRFFSDVASSLLHRCSIEAMDLRWSNDGVTMEYLRKKSEQSTTSPEQIIVV